MQLTKLLYNTKYNSSGSGTFLDNTIEAIIAASMREFALDSKDSIFFLLDNAYNGASGLNALTHTIANLKSILTVSINNVIVFYRDTSSGDSLKAYELVSGTDAESLPSIARPNDYDGAINAKVWKQIVSGGGSTEKTVSTSGGTITLDFNSLSNVIFVGSASFSGAKTWALSNSSNGLELTIIFEIITTLGDQTFPSTFVMSDARWDNSTHKWSPIDLGKYKLKANYDGANWYADIFGPYQ